MPILRIFTNLPKSSIPKDFDVKLVPIVAKSLDKPEDFIMILVVPDASLSLNKDSKTPTILASLESVGGLGLKENKIIAKTVTDYFQKQLSVHPDQIFLTFHDLDIANAAKSGTTAA